MTKEEKAKKLESRRRWRAVFSSQYGDTVLGDLLYMCGLTNPNPAQINPILVSFGNKIIDNIGGGIDCKHLVDNANDKDLIEEKAEEDSQ